MSGNGKTPLGKTRILNAREERALAGIVAGKTKTQALIDAGYAESTARHAANPIIRRMAGELCQTMTAKGFGADALADVLIKGATTEDLRAAALFTRQIIEVCGDAAPVKHEHEVSGHITLDQVRKEQSRLENALDSWLK